MDREVLNRTWLSRTPVLTSLPFPHVVIDGIFKPDWVPLIEQAFPPVSDPRYRPAEHLHSRKASIQSPGAMPSLLLRALEELRTPSVLNWLSEMTGFTYLKTDDEWFGEGVHTSTRGGFLDLHADFTLHPKGWTRVLNALIYFCPGWQDIWGGGLTLWSPTYSKIVPIQSNRMVLFETSDHSFHGFPDPLRCPEGRQRNVLQLYYYSAQYSHGPLLRTTVYPVSAQPMRKRLRRRLTALVGSTGRSLLRQMVGREK